SRKGRGGRSTRLRNPFARELTADEARSHRVAEGGLELLLAALLEHRQQLLRVVQRVEEVGGQLDVLPRALDDQLRTPVAPAAGRVAVDLDPLDLRPEHVHLPPAAPEPHAVLADLERLRL